MTAYVTGAQCVRHVLTGVRRADRRRPAMKEIRRQSAADDAPHACGI